MLDVSQNVMKLSKSDSKTLKRGLMRSILPTHRYASNDNDIKVFKITSFYWLLLEQTVQIRIKRFIGKAGETTGKPSINKKYFISL